MATSPDLMFNILLGYLVVSHAVFLYSHHKLVNKVMSRNYHEYETAKTVTVEKLKPVQEMEVPEDLRALQGFSV